MSSKWFIHPGPPLLPDEEPKELVLTNGEREVVYTPERTCRLVREPGSDRLWWCSYCGSYHEHESDFPWEHCPRCGARVIGGGE